MSGPRPPADTPSLDDTRLGRVHPNHANFATRRSQDELRDEVLDLLLGNINPAAEVITWSLVYIAQNPAVRDRLEQEADEVLGGSPISPSDYDKLLKSFYGA